MKNLLAALFFGIMCTIGGYSQENINIYTVKSNSENNLLVGEPIGFNSDDFLKSFKIYPVYKIKNDQLILKKVMVESFNLGHSGEVELTLFFNNQKPVYLRADDLGTNKVYFTVSKTLKTLFESTDLLDARYYNEGANVYVKTANESPSYFTTLSQQLNSESITVNIVDSQSELNSTIVGN